MTIMNFVLVETDIAIHKESDDIKFNARTLQKCKVIYNVWVLNGETEDMVHLFKVIPKNQSLISLFCDLRTENNQKITQKCMAGCN